MKRRNFDFVGKRKYFGMVTLAILCIGILFNIIFGTKMDIQFTGGSIIKYSYTGDIDGNQADLLLEDTVGTEVSLQYNYNVYVPGESEPQNNLSVSIANSSNLPVETTEKMLQVLQENFKENDFKQMEANSVDATMGREFFLKCMIAVILASVLMLIYVAFRFRKIGGGTAGMMALLALLNDVLVAYFTFVIFRIPLDDNFVAVVLTILGYSLNDTIVIYDRIRENRRLLGPKTDLRTLVNLSINQSFGRTVNTSLATFAAVLCVTVVALFYGLDSIISFAVPMMFGILSGFYTSVFLTAPFWVWVKEKTAGHKKAKAK